MAYIAVTGSVAYDTIMVFPGHFGEHILPEKTHMLNVSFLVDRMDKRRGGNAANIAWTLALLGERPLLAAAVGNDFGEYGSALASAGVDSTVALHCDDLATASCFITTDLDDNQLAAFYPGAMVRAIAVDLVAIAGAQDGRDGGIDYVVVAPDAPDAMASHIAQARTLNARLVFAPAQQIPSLSDEALVAGLRSAWMVVGNDYEMEMLRSRTGLTIDDLRRDCLVAVTKGSLGSEIYGDGDVVTVPPAPCPHVVDPTGAGDAYLAGLLAGLRRGLSVGLAGRVGSLAATYVLGHNGTQSHSYSIDEFQARYHQAFGEPLQWPPRRKAEVADLPMGEP